MLYPNLEIIDHHLYFNHKDCVELAKKYQTPLYVMDEDRIIEHCQKYLEYTNKYIGKDTIILYASKACDFKYLYEIINSQGLHVDVVSPCELHIALKANIEPNKIHYHGNNKSDEDIIFGIKNHVGYFIVDSYDELMAIDRIAKAYGTKQKILLRITPGIDPHTHKKIATGVIDSKFGTLIHQADEIISQTLSLDNIILEGFHCHIGSQLFDIEPYLDTIEIMFEFINNIKNEFKCNILDLGGGFPVRYTDNDPDIDLESYIKKIGNKIKQCQTKYQLYPTIAIEPGRSIVADAGITIYTIGSVKQVNNKTYVSIDGGMSDNPRYALYDAKYSIIAANKADHKKEILCTIAGRCCESGDLIQENIMLPQVKRNDIIAVLTTGAYNYSMASHYNQNQPLPVIMIKDGKDFIVVKRPSYDEMMKDML